MLIAGSVGVVRDEPGSAFRDEPLQGLEPRHHTLELACGKGALAVGIAWWLTRMADPLTQAISHLTGTARSVPQQMCKPGREVPLVADYLGGVDVKVGDKILFGKYGGTEVKVDGEELLVMREEDIMGVIEGA